MRSSKILVSSYFVSFPFDFQFYLPPTRSWQEGKFLIFDDSFEHEVWHEGEGLRLVLIVDFWHPDLTEQQRLSLGPI